MRPIDADALERVIKTECNPYGSPTIEYESGKRVLELIDRAFPFDITARPKGEWIKDRNPDKDGDYLCIRGVGDIYFRRILHFANDLYKKDPCDFYKYRYKRKDKRSGWYVMHQYGYVVVPPNVLKPCTFCSHTRIDMFERKEAKNEDT